MTSNDRGIKPGHGLNHPSPVLFCCWFGFLQGKLHEFSNRGPVEGGEV